MTDQPEAPAPSIRYAELDRDALRALAPRALAVLPFGATEQHGPHLPVGTDALAVTHVAEAAASRIRAEIPIVVAPTVAYGSSHHHVPFGGTLSLSTETFRAVATDLVVSLVDGGFRRVFLLNGHGGNDELLQLVARDVALDRDVAVAAGAYWTIASEALARRGPLATSWVPGHAGAFETSVVLALRPELPASERPRRALDPTREEPSPSYRVERHGDWAAIDGYTDDPSSADADIGRAYLDAIVPAVAAAFREFVAIA